MQYTLRQYNLQHCLEEMNLFPESIRLCVNGILGTGSSLVGAMVAKSLF
jgi:hypothetical protein